MAGTPDKGKFSTDIGNEVIEEALRAVKKRSPTDPEPAPADLQPEAPVDEAAAAVEGVALEPDALRKELEQLKLQLEFSQAKGRELMEKIKESHEKMLRAVADLENFKKRAQKEKEEVQRFGLERLLKDLLPVPDNLDRALEHSRTSKDFESLVKGLQMTRKLFEDTLARHGVKSFSAVGKTFDPRVHEAMQHVESSDMAPGMVAAEVLKGYTLNDRLVRPALVMVSKAKETANPASPPAAAGEGQGGHS